MPEATVIPSDTPVYVVGHNHAGYLPEGDPSLHLTIDGARATLADDLDNLADFVAESDPFTPDDVAQALSTSISASSESVQHDTDGDITYSLQRGGYWGTYEETGESLPTHYWIQTSTIGEQFPEGDDHSEEYGNLLDEYQNM